MIQPRSDSLRGDRAALREVKGFLVCGSRRCETLPGTLSRGLRRVGEAVYQGDYNCLATTEEHPLLEDVESGGQCSICPSRPTGGEREERYGSSRPAIACFSAFSEATAEALVMTGGVLCKHFEWHAAKESSCQISPCNVTLRRVLRKLSIRPRGSCTCERKPHARLRGDATPVRASCTCPEYHGATRCGGHQGRR